jgi:hypothetical protein
MDDLLPHAPLVPCSYWGYGQDFIILLFIPGPCRKQRGREPLPKGDKEPTPKTNPYSIPGYYFST